MSSEITIALEEEFDRHIERLTKAFESGAIDENSVSKAKKTHIIFNMDDVRTLGFANDQEVQYADVTTGTKEMTMSARITGAVHGRIELSLKIFKNKARIYPV